MNPSVYCKYLFIFFYCLGLAYGKYSVSRVYFEYVDESEELPDLDNLRKAMVSLGDPREEISLDALIDGRTKIRNLTDRDLQKLSEIPLQYLKSLGIEGMEAFPSEEDIEPESGNDLRIAGDTSVTIRILVPQPEKLPVQKRENNSTANHTLSRVDTKSDPKNGEYPISRIFYEYEGKSEGLPDLSELRKVVVSLGDPGEDMPLDLLLDGRTKIRHLSDVDLYRLSEIPLQYLKSLGFEGMAAFPAPEDIHPVSGKRLKDFR